MTASKRQEPIGSVVVAGGGIVGWSAAAALKRRLPMLRVTVVAFDPPAAALADRMVPTLPSIVEFHRDIGLTEADTVVRAGSGFRLGTRFEGWADAPREYVHAYGDYGQPLGPVPFHQHWLRAQDSRPESFDSYSAAVALGTRDRFIHPQHGQPLLSSFGYGLHIDPPRYCEMIRAYALHLGATLRPGTIADVRLRSSDGFIDAVVLEDGERLSADLFVDASGPDALLRGRLECDREDWSQWLPADRVVIAQAAPGGEPKLLDSCVAMPGGWSWDIRSPGCTSRGFVYSSRHTGDSDAQRLLADTGSAEAGEAPIRIAPGRLAEPWLRNCVAIGDSAVAVEPLEWTNLHLAHSAIDRLVAMMPDRDCSPVELWDFNRQAAAEADRVRDFIVLHYAIANGRSDPFWRDAATAEPPHSLAHTLTQFRERGRLPFYEEETFSRDSWVAVLLGQGVIPRRIDPLIDAVPQDLSTATLAKLRTSINRLAEAAPPAGKYLEELRARAE